MNIEEIVLGNKCKSCGACYSMCTANAIEMIYTDGFYRPKIKADECIQCGKCIKVCPAENEFEGRGLLGGYKKLILAHSTNSCIRHDATSGGVINTLVRFLLQEKIVDAVLMAGYDAESKIETSSQLITIERIQDLEKRTRDFSSRYVTVPVLAGLKKIPKNKKIAIVGTPCQIQAIKILGGG